MLYLLCLISVCLCAATEAAQNKEPKEPAVEYQVKASLIYNFLHFVTWPQAHAGKDENKFSVCLIGHDFYGAAFQALTGEIVGGKTISVKIVNKFSSDGWQEACRVVIFTKGNRKILRTALSSLRDKDVLTIGEAKNFLDEGGIIQFTIVNDTVQFKINLGSAKKARLAISSKLLRLANKVLQ